MQCFIQKNHINTVDIQKLLTTRHNVRQADDIPDKFGVQQLQTGHDSLKSLVEVAIFCL